MNNFDVQSFLSKLPGLPWSKYPFEKHLPNYSYCGPNTRLDIRLDNNDKPKPGEEPINSVDTACYKHDIAYHDSGDDLDKKHIADKILLQQLNAITNPTIRERLDRLLIKGAINTKLLFGAGFKIMKLNSKGGSPEIYANEIHKQYMKPRHLLKVQVDKIDDIWAADLIDVPTDRGYKKILTVIDLYSRYAFAEPLKNKTGITVKLAFEKIFKESGRKPKQLWVDKGSEFYNYHVKPLFDRIYSTENSGKSVVVERLNKTVRNMMFKQFTIQGTQKWFTLLPDIINKYNNKIHSAINETPENASKHPEKVEDINRCNNHANEHDIVKKKPKFKLNQRVRIFKWKNKFSKGFTGYWTEEVFRISEILYTTPITYKIKALDNEEILGTWYENELSPTEF